jgi:hypothetical protein
MVLRTFMSVVIHPGRSSSHVRPIRFYTLQRHETMLSPAVITEHDVTRPFALVHRPITIEIQIVVPKDGLLDWVGLFGNPVQQRCNCSVARSRSPRAAGQVEVLEQHAKE